MNEVKDYILKVTVAFEGGVVQKFTFEQPTGLFNEQSNR